ncbi:MAG: hypothetical protein ABSB74_03990 [Tepidisphaeraceae bacterium]
MDKTQKIEQLLECLIHVLGRTALPLDHVQEIVGTTPKQLKAFNLCDGTHSQAEVAKACKIAQGNLSRSFSRWIENGVAFWLGEGKEARLLHIYPIPSSLSARRRNRRGQ